MAFQINNKQKTNKKRSHKYHSDGARHIIRRGLVSQQVRARNRKCKYSHDPVDYTPSSRISDYESVEEDGVKDIPIEAVAQADVASPPPPLDLENYPTLVAPTPLGTFELDSDSEEEDVDPDVFPLYYRWDDDQPTMHRKLPKDFPIDAYSPCGAFLRSCNGLALATWQGAEWSVPLDFKAGLPWFANPSVPHLDGEAYPPSLELVADLANYNLSMLPSFACVDYDASVCALDADFIRNMYRGLFRPNPAQVWSIMRALTLFSTNKKEWISHCDVLLDMCAGCLPVHVQAQGAGDEIFRMMTGVKQVFSTFGDQAGAVWKCFLRALTANTFGLASQWLSVESLVSSFKKEITRHFSEATTAALRGITTMLTSSTFYCFIKTVIRMWMGYDYAALLVEIAFDATRIASEVGDLLSNFLTEPLSLGGKKLPFQTFCKPDSDCELSSFDFFVDSPPVSSDEGGQKTSSQASDSEPEQEQEVHAEGNDQPDTLTLITKFALAMGITASPLLLDVNTDHALKLCRNVSTTASALDKSGLSSAIGRLENYLLGEDPKVRERMRFEDTYPDTMRLVDKHSTCVLNADKITVSDKVAIRYLYGRALDEQRRVFDKKDIPALNMLSRPAFSYVVNNGLTACESARRSPSYLLFAGKPGLGKSWLSSCLFQAMHHALKKSFPTTSDLVHTIGSLDKYDSGYKNQTIWFYDDFLQAVDTAGSPSGDLDLLFRLVTTAPLHLNMADVASKGTTGRCNLVVGATNIDFFANPSANTKLVKAHLQSVVSADAVRRRLTHIIEPVCNAGFQMKGHKVCSADGVQAIPKYSPGEIFSFKVLNIEEMVVPSPTGMPLWTWTQILRLAYDEYMACERFSPDDVPADPGRDAFLNSLPAEPQGWFDNFRFLNKFRTDKFVCNCGGAPPNGLENASLQCIVKYNREHSARIEDALDHLYADHEIRQYSCPIDYACPPGFEKAFRCERLNGKSPLPHGTSVVSCLAGITTPGYYIIRPPPDFKGESVDEHYLVMAEWAGTLATVHLEPGNYLVPKITAGLMVMAMLVGASYKAYKVLMKRSEAYSLVDEEVYMYDAEAQVYISDASLHHHDRVQLDGRTFVRKPTPAGYKWYPQGGSDEPNNDNKFLSAIDSKKVPPAPPANARVDAQLPSLMASVFCLVSEGKRIGNMFCLGNGLFCIPTHVVSHMTTLDEVFVRKEDQEMRVVLNTKSRDNPGLVIRSVGSDMSVVEFAGSALSRASGCRDHISKLNVSPPAGGIALFISRSADGKVISKRGTYQNMSVSTQYRVPQAAVTLAPEECRRFLGDTERGDCGGIYLEVSSNMTSSIIGFHVAGGVMSNDARFGICHIPTLAMRNSRKTICSTSNLQCEGFDPAMAALGFPCAPTPYASVPPAKGKKVRSFLYDAIKPDADLAPLKPFTSPDGVLIDPMTKQLDKLSHRAHESQVLDHTPTAAIDAIIRMSSFHYLRGPQKPWSEVVGPSEASPSVDRTASAGIPFEKFGGTKGCLFQDTQEVVLTPEGEAFLEECDRRLAPADWATRPYEDFEELPSVAKACLKDEARTLEKCAAGKTRLFTAVPVHEVLLQRRYFGDYNTMLTSKNLLVSSALGISPENFGFIHDSLMEVDDPLILTLDFEYMDGHTTPGHISMMKKLFTGLKGGNFVGETRMHEGVEVDRELFVQHRLLDRLAHFLMGAGKLIFRPDCSHPSGSTITCAVNHVNQHVTFLDFFSHVTGLPPSVALSQMRCVFLGDDSIIAIPRSWGIHTPALKEFFRGMGFRVTAGDKKSEISCFEPWDGIGVSQYAFLSRRFVRKGHECVGVLEPERIDKMLAFTTRNKLFANMPEQFLAFCQELLLHRRFDTPAFSQLFRKYTVILDSRFRPGILQRCLDYLEAGDCDSLRFEFLDELVQHCEAQGGSDHTEALGGNSPEDTATFIEDVVESIEQAQTRLQLEAWKRCGMEQGEHSEAAVFTRPHVIGEFSWTPTTADNAFSTYGPTSYFANNPNASFKLANNAFLTGTFVIRVVITSSPYVSGKLLLHARPAAANPAVHITEVSGDPCVEIDASSGKTAEIRVPCVMPMGYAQVQSYDPGTVPNRVFDWAQVGLWVASPVKSVATPGVSVKVFAWIEEAMLHGPTYTNFTISPQSGGVVPQEDGTNRFLKRAHKAVRTFGGILTDTAKMVPTALSLAAMAGLSDPNMINNTTYVTQMTNFDAPHLHGACPALNMASNQNQKIVLPYGAFCCDSDEMQVSHYVSRPGLLTVIPWKSTDQSESTIKSFRVSPGLFKTWNDTIRDNKAMTPVTAVSSLFLFWRGALRYRLAAAKTRFHAGVIEILWRMGLPKAAVVNDAQAAICYRAIWDIQESTDFEFTCPYVNNTMWAPSLLQDVDTAVQTSGGPSECTGVIQLRVINPLQDGSGTVTDQIELLLYMSGEKDFCVSVPSLSGEKLLDIDPVGKGKEEIAYPLFVEAQGVFQEDTTAGVSTVHPPLALAPATSVPDISSLACIGEEVNNLRPLLRRFSDFVEEDRNTFSVQDLFIHHPFVARMAEMFAFYTGGTRVMFEHVDNTFVKLRVAKLRYLRLELLGLPIAFYKYGDPMVLQVPYHNVVPYVPVSSALDAPNWDVIVPKEAAARVKFAVGSGDDFSFGWQIGVRPRPYSVDVSVPPAVT